MHPITGWVERCAACGYQRSTLRPGAGTGIDGLESLRRANFELILDRLEVIRPLRGARILEIGSAWGWFLEAATRRGAVAHGIEPEAANVELSRAAGHSVELGFFPSDLRDQGPYDLIVFNDVFEHIPDPAGLGAELERRLAPGGLLVINLPSSDGTIYRIASMFRRLGFASPYERLWQKDFASPHVSYFNPASLRRMIEGHSRLAWQSTFALPSVVRDGLGERIRSSHRGALGSAIHAGMWGLSYLLPLLPADIVVVVFRAPPR